MKVLLEDPLYDLLEMQASRKLSMAEEILAEVKGSDGHDFGERAIG